MAKKSAVRTVIYLVCSKCKAYMYTTEKNKRNDPDRLNLNKFCRKCRQKTEFVEKR